MEGFWEYARTMWEGPGHLRFLVQPTLAILLGILDGRQDARRGLGPFGAQVVRGPSGERRQKVGEAIRRLAFPLVMAVLLSAVFQWVIVKRFHPLASLAFAVLLVALPYSLARGLANRATRHPPFEYQFRH
jgi:hypothetical protein